MSKLFIYIFIYLKEILKKESACASKRGVQQEVKGSLGQ